MAATSAPRDAVVSIWHEAQNAFLGSGAFIVPHLVLTAKHLVQEKAPEAIHIRLVDGFDHISPQAFHCHDTVDIAVIDLGREFPNQHMARLDCQRSGLEGATVDIYGVNPDTHNRDECRGYTLGTWHDTWRGYLFDHAQRKGFSGGIVVHDGDVIGIMTRRHETEQQGVMFPLAEVADWLQGFFPASTFLPNPSPVSGQTALAQHAFTRQVRQEVGQLLQRQVLRPLRAKLLTHVANAELHDAPENVLIPLDEAFAIESSLTALRHATGACRYQLAEQGTDTMQAMLSGALDIFGWLVLLTVSEDWVQKRLGVPERAAGEVGGHFQDLLGATYIALPVETETGTQVVESRLREQRATFELDDKGYEVWSPNRVRLGDLELGIASDDELSQIQKLIWATVHKGVEVPEPFRSFHAEELQETLDIRYQDGESYYVMLPARRGGPAAGQETLFHLLRRALPHLGAFLIGMETGEQVLVMNETRLRSLTREFLRVLQGE